MVKKLRCCATVGTQRWKQIQATFKKKKQKKQWISITPNKKHNILARLLKKCLTSVKGNGGQPPIHKTSIIDEAY